MNLEYLSTALAYRVRIQDTEQSKGYGAYTYAGAWASASATDSSDSTETKHTDGDGAEADSKVIEDGGLLLDDRQGQGQGQGESQGRAQTQRQRQRQREGLGVKIGSSGFVNMEYDMPAVLSAVAKAAVCIHDPYQTWQLIEQSVQQQLVEFKYKWKERILENLELDFIPGADKRNDLSQSTYLNGYKFPHVYLYLVKCDDLEAYKSNVKLRLQAWVDKLKKVASKGQVDFEWFIVYVPKKESPKASGLLKKSNARQVFDRIKADFNHSPHPSRARKDKDRSKESANRCCKISLFEAHAESPGKASAQLSHGAARAAKMSDFLEMLCSKLAAAFDQRHDRLQAEISAKEELRYSNGWNFYNFFVLKESLAFLWMQIGQYKEALAIYDSLASMFVELSHSQTLHNSGTSRPGHSPLYDSTLAHLKRWRPPDQTIDEPPPPPSTSFETPKAASRNAEDGEQGSHRSSPLVASSNSSKKTLSLAMSYGKNAASFNSPRRSMRRRHTSSAASKATTASNATTPPPTASTISESIGSASPGFGLLGSGHGNGSGAGSGHEEAVVPSWLLDVTRKSFRDQIFTNNVSTVDLEMYIFARQALLLLSMSAPDEALRRGMQVVRCIGNDIASKCSFVKDKTDDVSLTSTEASLIADAWTFCASIDLICAANTASARTSSYLSHTVKRDVYMYIDAILADAQRTLQRLASTACPASAIKNRELDPNNPLNAKRERWRERNPWLRQLPTFVWKQWPTSAAKELLGSQVLSDWLPAGLLGAITERDSFLSLYDQLLDCRAAHSVAAGRHRLAATSSFNRALLLCAFDQVEPAMHIISRIARTAALDSWPMLAGELLLLRIHCETRLGSAADQITAFLEALHPDLPLRHRTIAQAGLQALQVQEGPEAPLLRFSLSRFPIVSLPSMKTAGNVFAGEKARIVVEVVSTLPRSCTMKEIRLYLHAAQSLTLPTVPDQGKGEGLEEEMLQCVLVDDEEEEDAEDIDQDEHSSDGALSERGNEGKLGGRQRAQSCEGGASVKPKMLRRKRSSTMEARMERLPGGRRNTSWMSKRRSWRSRRSWAFSSTEVVWRRKSSGHVSVEVMEPLELAAFNVELQPGKNKVEVASSHETSSVGEYLLAKWAVVLGSVQLESAMSQTTGASTSVSPPDSRTPCKMSVEVVPAPQVLRFSTMNALLSAAQRTNLTAQKLFFRVDVTCEESRSWAGQLYCQATPLATTWRLYTAAPGEPSHAKLLPVGDDTAVSVEQSLRFGPLADGAVLIVEMDVRGATAPLPESVEVEVRASLEDAKSGACFGLAHLFEVPVVEPFDMGYEILRIRDQSFLKLTLLNALNADLEVVNVTAQAKGPVTTQSLVMVGACAQMVVLAHEKISLMYALDATATETGSIEVTLNMDYLPLLPGGVQAVQARFEAEVALVVEEISTVTVELSWAGAKEKTMQLGQSVHVRYSIRNESRMLRIAAAHDERIGEIDGRPEDMYELMAGEGDWLVVGKDRGRLEVTSCEPEVSFHIVPLKLGLLKLPWLELRHRLARSVRSDAGKGVEESSIVRIEP